MEHSSSATAERWGMQARCGLASMFLVLVVVFALAGIAAAQSSAKVTQRRVRKVPPAASVQPEPAFEMTPVAPPPPPLTPGQMPPNAPMVAYDDGFLTITAENSTLSDILNAVSARIGAIMDVPASSGSERVWANLGPGPARAILASLLSGTSLDYVIQSSDTDQNQIQNVLLSVRTKGGKVGDSNGGETFSSRFRQYMNHQNTGLVGASDSDSAAADSSSADADASAAVAATTQPAGTPSAEANPATTPDARPLGDPAAPLSARLPLAITEADAHPAPIADPQQAIPQMQNLFELRRQLQEQQNAQQKAGVR